jgi:3-oxoacyl-[acyl-carrier-protein] synthase III
LRTKSRVLITFTSPGNHLAADCILDIIAQGAWNGGTLVDNSIFENKGMFFKGGIPVNDATIQQRVGVRTRMAAPENERIGVSAMDDLLRDPRIDPARVKLVIGATNVGDDKHDPGPAIRYPFERIRARCPKAMVLDLYAGCPGFNVSVELAFMLSLAGFLEAGDLSIVVGAENVHRANVFPPGDTANTIFGDDALATALETKCPGMPEGVYRRDSTDTFSTDGDFVSAIAGRLLDLIGKNGVDGIIIDNRLGKFVHRVPATAARVQHRLVERLFPEEAAEGIFSRFKEACEFYDERVKSFAFDIMTLDGEPGTVDRIAEAYVRSGKHSRVASVFLDSDRRARVTLHQGKGGSFERPKQGVIDTATTTHGCFADYIQGVETDGDVFAEMDGKGVFLYATRGARTHLSGLLAKNGMTLQDVDLLIEHQANFAMIPMTLEKVLAHGSGDVEPQVADFVADRMLTNIQERGNCSVVCMQRLPYDLARGALREDTVQGYPVNRNLERLRAARTVLYDSVGSGMTRSSVLLVK